ncbi:hypothetical protein V8C86DRAFT_1215571 [Haematococcus lacustris]
MACCCPWLRGKPSPLQEAQLALQTGEACNGPPTSQHRSHRSLLASRSLSSELWGPPLVLGSGKAYCETAVDTSLVETKQSSITQSSLDSVDFDLCSSSCRRLSSSTLRSGSRELEDGQSTPGAHAERTSHQPSPFRPSCSPPSNTFLLSFRDVPTGTPPVVKGSHIGLCGPAAWGALPTINESQSTVSNSRNSRSSRVSLPSEPSLSAQPTAALHHKGGCSTPCPPMTTYATSTSASKLASSCGVASGCSPLPLTPPPPTQAPLPAPPGPPAPPGAPDPPDPPATELGAVHTPPHTQAERPIVASQSGSTAHGVPCWEQLKQLGQAEVTVSATHPALAQQEVIMQASGSGCQLGEGQARGQVEQQARADSRPWRLVHDWLQQGKAAEAAGPAGPCGTDLISDSGGPPAVGVAVGSEQPGDVQLQRCGSSGHATRGSSAAQSTPGWRPLPSSMDLWSNSSGSTGQASDASRAYHLLLSHIQQQAMLQQDPPQPTPPPPTRSPPPAPGCAPSPSPRRSAPAPAPPPVPPDLQTHRPRLQQRNGHLARGAPATPAQPRGRQSLRLASDWPLIMSLVDEEEEAGGALGQSPGLVWRDSSGPGPGSSGDVRGSGSSSSTGGGAWSAGRQGRLAAGGSPFSHLLYQSRQDGGWAHRLSSRASTLRARGSTKLSSYDAGTIVTL